MATFYVEGKPKLTIILGDNLKICHVIEKCLCAMFGFQPFTVHISKDDAFDDNNSVIKFVYQVLLMSAHGSGWTFCASRFRTLGENYPKELLGHCLHVRYYGFYC
jgi:hypothetical protein